MFQEQYYNSPWFTQGNREFSTRLMAGFFALMEEGQQQEIRMRAVRRLGVISLSVQITRLGRSG